MSRNIIFVLMYHCHKLLDVISSLEVFGQNWRKYDALEKLEINVLRP
jgi:hypothetical protein